MARRRASRRRRSARGTDNTLLTANGNLVLVSYNGAEKAFAKTDKVGVSLGIFAKEQGLTTYRAYDQDGESITTDMADKSFASAGILSASLNQHDKAGAQ